MARQTPRERTFDDLVKRDLRTREYGPVYVFDGDDAYRIESVIERLKADALDAASAAFNVHTFHGDQTGWSPALQQAQGYPMFGSRQLVLLKQVDRIARDDRAEATLAAYLEAPATTTIFVMTAEKLDRRRKWVQDVRARGYLVHFEAPEGEALVTWAAKAAQRAGLTIGRDALQTLTDLVGRNLQSLAGEIEKLALLSDTWQRPPTADDVMRVVMDQAELKAFTLTDTLEPGGAPTVMATWRKLAELGEDPYGLTPIVMAHLRRMAVVSAMLADGESPDAIAANTGIHPWVVRNKLVPLARRLGPHGAARTLRACLACERALKGRPVPPALTFEALLLNVSLPETRP